MNRDRFDQITSKYSSLRISVVGDVCLDRYMEIDPSRNEVSIETGLPVYNVVNVRSQPGAAGTILNNLVSLGVGVITPVGFCGDDGEGYELLAALRGKRGLCLDHFLRTPHRRTFTYCKPIVLEPGGPPRELNRLDSKNFSRTPERVQRALCASVAHVSRDNHAVIVMDQVDTPETGTVTPEVLEAIRSAAGARPEMLILGDSRQTSRDWPPMSLKMNLSEFQRLIGTSFDAPDEIATAALTLARHNKRHVFVTLAERGIVGATPHGECTHCPARPVRGPIDVVGAGDAVMANLAAAIAAGASLHESLELAMAAASAVLHQLGTTGSAGIADLRTVMFPA